MSRGVCALLAVLLCGGCGEDPLTQLVVAVDTDLSVPEEIDALRVDVVGPAGELRRSSGPLDAPSRLPASVGVVHRGGALDPVVVTATASHAGVDVVQVTARVAFVQDEARVLRLFLSRACVGRQCAADQTCDRGGCRSERFGPEELEPWTGFVDRVDAGPANDAGRDGGADGCVPTAEQCNEVDDDCDGDVDEDFDFDDDPDHCGGCDLSCAENPQHAAGVCVDRICRLLCDDEFDDCDDDPDTGCEAFLGAQSSCGSCGRTCEGATPLCASDGVTVDCVASCGADLTECGTSCVDTDISPRHCGACDATCDDPPHGTGVCVGGGCDFVCDAGWGDCTAAEGCETSLRTLSDCGGCGVACEASDALTSCLSGVCDVVGCLGAKADCDGRTENGCEIDLASDTANCGACGAVCAINPPNGRSVCTPAGCGVVCDPGFRDCNGMLGDGCEVNLASPGSCGSCGIRCTASAPLCTGDPASGFRCVHECLAPKTLCGASCVDSSADALHCGGCNAPCPIRSNATRTCADGVCGFVCLPGYADCDGTAANGCEAPLGTLVNCAGCGDSCAYENATASCVAGVGCALDACLTGFDDCDMDDATGCETDVTSDPGACNGCGMECPTPDGALPVCDDRACGYTCVEDRGDCDGAAATGCETDLAIATAHCGACGFDCAALPGVQSATCSAGACSLTCVAGSIDCDGDPTNGCECAGVCAAGVCS